MPLNDFESLLKQTVGLDPSALGRAVIDRAMRDRASACALQDWRDYLEHAQATEAELQALVDAIVVPETWFYRDRPAFDLLGRLAVQNWLTTSHGDSLRLLSVGCGSGEEPYSMVMELLDAGFPAERIHIDAVDISALAIARARQGVYGKESFRGTELGFVERYFKPVHDGFKLDAKVRDIVSFSRGNALADPFPSGEGGYDFILCRNLLIYFDATAQERVLGELHDALGKNGVVLVGPGEAHLPVKPEFVPVEVPNAPAFLKAGKRQIRAATHTARILRTQLMARPAAKPAASQRIPTPLELAERLVERGQYADATRLCEAEIRDHGESAQALYILGRAHDGQGEIETARGFYHRVLQMNAEHTFASLRLAQLPDSSVNGRSPQAKSKWQA